MNPVYYLTPEAVGVHPFTGKHWRNTSGKPVPVTKDYGSSEAGCVYCELATGEYLRVETGKGHIVGKHWVEGGRP